MYEYSDFGFTELAYSMASKAWTSCPGGNGHRYIQCDAALPFNHAVSIQTTTMELSMMFRIIMYTQR
jgi:hypothetical protein